MIVQVTGSTAAVEEPQVLTALEVRAPEGVDLAGSLGDLGRATPDGDHVWLRIAALEARAVAGVDAADQDGWHDGFAAMISYARTKGWVDEGGTEVRAHVTRTAP